MIHLHTDIIECGKRALQTEANVIQQLAETLDEHFEHVIEAIMRTKGHLIVSGMGKSGLIGRKMAATFASTGTPSFFLHPGDAFHGDLGMVKEQDTILLISHSGETNEILNIIPFFRENGNTIIALTGNSSSTLAKHAHFSLIVAVDKEACPLDLAPTSSTTATLAMGDALAVSLMKTKDFQPENFARFHPGGTLGRRLLVRVRDVMRSTDLPFITGNATIQEVIHTVSLGRLGLAIVLSAQHPCGIITDGDIRRAMDTYQKNFFSLQAKDIMTANPKTILPDAKLTTAANLMNKHKIGSLLVLDGQKVQGVIQVYDLKL